MHRALVEGGVPIDAVAGVSARSLFALAIARGCGHPVWRAEARRLLIGGGSLLERNLAHGGARVRP